MNKNQLALTLDVRFGDFHEDTSWDEIVNFILDNYDPWRPIEEAPKDGTDILAWDGNHHEVLFFSQHGHGWSNGNPKVEYKPTHFTPLPKGPSE